MNATFSQDIEERKNGCSFFFNVLWTINISENEKLEKNLKMR